MQNKLCVSEAKFLNIERELVNLRLNLLDNYFNNDENIFNINYLKNIHTFLFCNLYFPDDLKLRELIESETQELEFQLNYLKYLCLNESNNKEAILKSIEGIWYLQPFFNGNTRTLMAYLSIINRVFLLDLNIDLNKEIISKPSIFNLNSFVNQKRLTKTK